MTLRSERPIKVACEQLDFGRIKRWNFGEDLFIFGDHLILAGKTVEISEKYFFLFLEITWFWPNKLLKFPKRLFFFLRSHHFSDQFSPSITDFTKPQFRHIWAGPEPTFGSLRPWVGQYFWVRVGGPELVGPFATLQSTPFHKQFHSQFESLEV